MMKVDNRHDCTCWNTLLLKLLHFCATVQPSIKRTLSLIQSAQFPHTKFAGFIWSSPSIQYTLSRLLNTSKDFTMNSRDRVIIKMKCWYWNKATRKYLLLLAWNYNDFPAWPLKDWIIWCISVLFANKMFKIEILTCPCIHDYQN